MTDQRGPWEDYGSPAAVAIQARPEPMPVPNPVELAPHGAPPPAEDGPWADYSPGAAPTPRNLPIAPTAHNERIGGFADQLPPQPAHRMSEKDEATYSNMLKTADAATLKRFLWEHGNFQQPGLDEYVAARDKARAKGAPVSYDVTYALPKVSNADGATGAATRGVGRGATANFLDEAGALVDAVGGTDGRPNIWNSDQSFGDLYDRNLDYNRAVLGADDRDHPYASLAGEVAGSLVLPGAIEKAGVTASLNEVRLAARNAALMEGYSGEEAARIGARAVARRLATEGAIYGGAYGAGSADGGPGSRIVGAGTGAIAGAALPVAGRVLSPITAPIRNSIASAADAVYNGGRRLISPFTREGAQDTAAEILRNSATRPTSDIVADIANAAPPVAGVRPTLAEVAGDPGLAGLQRGHANTDLNTAAAIGERNAANALARTRATSEALGDGSPQAIQDYAAGRMASAEQATVDQRAARQAAIDTRLAGERQLADQGHSDAVAAVSQAIDRLGPTADREATGAAAREAFDTAYDAAKARTREAYADAALNNPRPIKIPPSVFQKLRLAADDFYGDGGGEMPARLQSILNDMADEHATTRTLTNIDRRLADFAGEARMQGRRSEAAFAERVRADLGNFVQNAAPPEYRAAIANAKAVRAEQGRLFEGGDAAATFARDRYGNPAIGNTTVPTRLVRPGAAGGDTAEELIRAIGPENAENIVREEIRRVAEERGVQTGAQARALANRFGEAANRFPAVRDDLRNLQARAAELDAARGVQHDAISMKATVEELASASEMSALHKQLVASPLAKVADTTVDPSSFVKGLMQRSDDGRQLRQLAAMLRTKPEAMAGLRRVIGDYIIDAGAGPNFTAAGDRIPAINKTRAAIDTVLKRAAPALTREQAIVLKVVRRELEQANFAATASKPSGSETQLNKTFVDLMRHAPAVVGKKAKLLIAHVLGALGNGQEVKSLITEAVLNPDFAATLLKRPTERHWSQIREGLIGRKAVMGGAIVGQAIGDHYGLRDLLLTAVRRAASGIQPAPQGDGRSLHSDPIAVAR
ncbi:hypothetical protein NED98_13160 [Sphingomonas sp. MMSM20]|uniref:hypothetical protein n=1 Tax=Sphingomonas lycopersici TaxID=2951807 RepID=UPI002237A0BB|nr:hypothetical protein [Sphingomonas lycopersici]MCW6531195.1 hypothetical protein [Sphingomonas lycopersici]